MNAIMSSSDLHENVTILGNLSAQPSKTLETFPNPAPNRDFHIHMEIPEFTCLCPKTGQPDFATLFLDYIPDRRCVELKSLKLYIWSYRNEGTFHEAVTNRILNDIATATSPRCAASAISTARTSSSTRSSPATAASVRRSGPTISMSRPT